MRYLVTKFKNVPIVSSSMVLRAQKSQKSLFSDSSSISKNRMTKTKVRNIEHHQKNDMACIFFRKIHHWFLYEILFLGLWVRPKNNDAVKCGILKSKMEISTRPVPVNKYNKYQKILCTLTITFHSSFVDYHE